MKKHLLSLLFIGTLTFNWAQTQIGNSNFETWENVSDGQEPTNWSSFLSATGAMSWAASDQCESSADIRPGSTGTKSLKIFSLDVFGVIANGNCTVGRINMGSADPSNANNYNSSITTDTQYSEVMTDSPDSVVFWAKFAPNSGNTTDSARISAIIHDNFAFRDPIDANSQSHVVATAIKNFAKTDGNWVRIAVPFDYSGPATTPAFILLTFATNKTPGGGEGDDQLWIDDMELIYNPGTANVNELTSDFQVVNQNGKISFLTKNNLQGDVEIYSTSGALVTTGTTSQTFDMATKGVFVVRIQSGLSETVQHVSVH